MTSDDDDLVMMGSPALVLSSGDDENPDSLEVHQLTRVQMLQQHDLHAVVFRTCFPHLSFGFTAGSCSALRKSAAAWLGQFFRANPVLCDLFAFPEQIFIDDLRAVSAFAGGAFASCDSWAAPPDNENPMNRSKKLAACRVPTSSLLLMRGAAITCTPASWTMSDDGGDDSDEPDEDGLEHPAWIDYDEPVEALLMAQLEAAASAGYIIRCMAELDGVEPAEAQQLYGHAYVCLEPWEDADVTHVAVRTFWMLDRDVRCLADELNAIDAECLSGRHVSLLEAHDRLTSNLTVEVGPIDRYIGPDSFKGMATAQNQCIMKHQWMQHHIAEIVALSNGDVAKVRRWLDHTDIQFQIMTLQAFTHKSYQFRMFVQGELRVQNVDPRAIVGKMLEQTPWNRTHDAAKYILDKQTTLGLLDQHVPFLVGLLNPLSKRWTQMNTLLGILQKIRTQLAPHTNKFAALLNEPHLAHAALLTLGSIDDCASLSAHADAVVVMTLPDKPTAVRVAALSACVKIEPKLLLSHVHKFMNLLEHTENWPDQGLAPRDVAQVFSAYKSILWKVGPSQLPTCYMEGLRALLGSADQQTAHLARELLETIGLCFTCEEVGISVPW